MEYSGLEKPETDVMILFPKTWRKHRGGNGDFDSNYSYSGRKITITFVWKKTANFSLKMSKNR
jgi:hypothetical protein